MVQGNWEIELNNGEVTELSLNFKNLYLLRESGEQGKSVYDLYMKIRTKEKSDELDNIYVIYTAYVCAHLDAVYLSFEDFLDLVPADRPTINLALEMLLQGKKKKQDLQQLLTRSQNAEME